ncbi:hypothetical protein SADUNF_Sadunf05G0163400 [Salix dunnii]|uniref:40S ribosomal protein S15 n=1 Tax=Salix dunnii TaxID=1413687 RepID=A0A835MZP3_9ROSI|nr:hypothetical protein SADUNF_Sadunf05G0163400 [Salix dunnii]
MAEVEPDVAAAGAPKKRTFKKFSFRGVDLDALLDMSTDELVKLFPARARRRFQRGLKRKPMALIKKLRKAVRFFRCRGLLFVFCICTDAGSDECSVKKCLDYDRQLPISLGLPSHLDGNVFSNVTEDSLTDEKRDAPPGEKPEPVRTHLRNMIIVPEMIGSVIGVYNGKTFNQVEIKPEMISHYLAEFSISYKPVKHGRPGIGATHSSRFIPLK